MAVFTARRFKLPGKGTSSGLTMARNQLSILRSKAERFGLSSAELQNLIDAAEGLKASMSDPDDRLSMDVVIEGYKSERQQLDDKRAGIDGTTSYFDSQKKDIEAQARYLAGNNPVQYLTGLKEGYDRLIGSYNETIQNTDDSQDVTAYSLKLDELVRDRNETLGMLKKIEENSKLPNDQKQSLEGMAYVVTPDANGGIADVSVKPRRLLQAGEFRTDLSTPEGIPIFVVPNQDVLGVKQAVIGNSVFKEKKFDYLTRQKELQAEKLPTDQINAKLLQELQDPNRERTFQLEGNGTFDIGGVKVDTSIPDGDYGVGAGGVYKRLGNAYQKVEGTPRDLGLKPWQYRRLDSSLEAAIQPMVTSAPQATPPATFSVPTNVTPSSLGSAEAAPEEPPFEASVPTGPAAPPRKPQEATGLERAKGMAQKIFGGVFGTNK